MPQRIPISLLRPHRPAHLLGDLAAQGGPFPLDLCSSCHRPDRAGKTSNPARVRFDMARFLKERREMFSIGIFYPARSLRVSPMSMNALLDLSGLKIPDKSKMRPLSHQDFQKLASFPLSALRVPEMTEEEDRKSYVSAISFISDPSQGVSHVHPRENWRSECVHAD
jgi:hypothetical protein